MIAGRARRDLGRGASSALRLETLSVVAAPVGPGRLASPALRRTSGRHEAMAFVPPGAFTARFHRRGIPAGRQGALSHGVGGGGGGGGAGVVPRPAVARGRCLMLAVADGQDPVRPSTASRVDEQLLEAHATYEVWSEQLSSVSEETDPEWYATVCAKLAEAEEEVMRLVVAAPVATVADTGADLPPSPSLADFVNRSRRFAIDGGGEGAAAAADEAVTSLVASDKAFAVLTVRPSLSLKLPISRGVLESYRDMGINDLGRLTLDRSFEPLAQSAVPKGVTVVGRGTGGDASSQNRASAGHQMLPDFLLPLPSDSAAGRSSAPSAGFTACSLDLQSVSQSAVAQWFWNPLVTMVNDQFVGPQGHWRYYSAPPVAYCLVGLPFVGFFIAIEWVGKLHATIASDPFFVGTKQQAEAARKLPMRAAGPYMDVPLDEGCWASQRSAADVMGKVYTIKPMINDRGDLRFYKVVPCMAFDREAADELSAPLPSLMFRWLFYTYRRYEQILADAGDKVPAMLVPATLRFGAFSVLVDMPFVAGRDGVEADFQDPDIIEALADVVVWLAHRGLLYYDLRPANIRVANEGGDRKVTLIDYDDMLVRDVGSISTMASYEESLKEEGRQRRYPLTKPLTHYTTVRAAIERAFAASPPPAVPASASGLGGAEDTHKTRFMRAWSLMGKPSAVSPPTGPR